MTCFNANRWNALMRAAGIQSDDRSSFQELARRYSEPHRHYHTGRHIDDCLEEFDLVRDLASDPIAVELAIFLHDIIYEPRATDNEERSAQFSSELLREADTRRASHVSELILTTKTHEAGSVPDAALLLDIDLGILGKPPNRFAEYNDAIRKEYDWVPIEIYKVKRAEVLASFLSRDRIYITDHFHNRYETSARRNICRAIES